MSDHDGEKQFTQEARQLTEDEYAEQRAMLQAELDKVRERQEQLNAERPQVIEEEGAALLPAVWQYQVVEHKGETWQYRKPKELAVMFLGSVGRRNSKPATRMEALVGFLENNLSPDSMTRCIQRAQTHDDTFDVADMFELVDLIAADAGKKNPELLAAKK